MDIAERKEILKRARELDVKFIRLQFTDILGVLKNVAITVDRLEEALDGEVAFDGSSIEGFVRVEESDMLLMPDLSTFALFPWRPRDGSVARLICDIYNPDGTPFAGCPRAALRRVLDGAQKAGYEVHIGVEGEFFLFHTDEAGNPTTTTHDKGSYFDLTPVDLGENARRDMVLTLDEMGIRVQASHHEVAPGQHEIAFRHDEALRTADNIVTFRYVVRAIAQRHGLYASFMPKPIYGVGGSGLHLSHSIFCDGQNIFFDPNGKYRLSESAFHYIGGLLSHSPALTAITNPTVNSYKRLVPGFEAPSYIAWSFQNRSPLVRIPFQRGKATRIELRSPDPTCNPYLAIAASIKAGLDGIGRRIEPPEPIQGSTYGLTEEERQRLNLRRLPRNLMEALGELSRDEVIKSTLGDHIYNKFVQAKCVEWEDYSTKIHQWELDEYLAKF
ncbi:MAG: type I glutamate--ammonia ligase [Firmicutes bacterium]|nr:type I glutamate--ammonia ligase [Bacillota bacterium]